MAFLETIPPPEIPRGPEYKYSAQYYCDRNARDSVKPPVIAPIAEGPCWPSDPTKKSQPGGMRADAMTFNCAPMPGHPWWWDGHCYYECVPDPPARNCPPPSAPCPPAEAKKC
ncbi:hypothetical protein MSG28_012362 [Choristoneura fumiferana]|uniref:Uncharacterized protein n=1 Tax=Choristoneura fumiferana TaxID=7141 RepID=A0ACC0KDI0_CHOFU|nr:hypothetical protein MSG28_012362 [Choristoneura fumiferana]